MKPKQAFGIAVRIIGLILLIIALLYIASGFVVLFDPQFKPNLSPAWHYFLDGIVGVLISLYLLRGASHIVRFAYPEEDSETKPNSN
jgi:hypothetical protein